MDSPIAFTLLEHKPFTVRAARSLLYRFLLLGMLCIVASAWMSILGNAMGSAPFLFLYGIIATAVAAYLYVLTLEMRDDEDDL